MKGQNAQSLIFIAGILAVVILLARQMVQGFTASDILLILGLIMGVFALTILKSWRTGFYLFLLWLIFEDLIRKYMGNNMVIYFGKDILVGVIYLAFLLVLKRGREQIFRPPFLTPLLLFVMLGITQMFNPNSPSLFYGLAGLKLYFYYIPLMFLGYALISSEKDLRLFLIFNMSVACIVAFLGIVQAVVGLDFLNPKVLAPELRPLGRLVRQTPISGALVPRPTSVFVSDGRFAWYMLMMFLLGFGAAGYLFLRGDKGRRISFIELGLVTIAIILSGSRGTFMYTLGSMLVLTAAFLWGLRQHERTRLVKLIQGLFAVAGFGVLVMLLFYPGAVSARWSFYYETIAPWSPRSELVWRLRDYPIGNFLAAFTYPYWPIGYGIGTASLGRQYVSRFLKVPEPRIGVESGYGTLILELGILGLALWAVWTVTLILSGWRIMRTLRGTSLFPVGSSILWFAFLLLFPLTYGGMQPYQNFIFNAYLWLLVGILFRLSELAALDKNMEVSEL